MSDVRSSLRVRAVMPEDEQAVIKLFKSALGEGPTGELTADFFAWKHRANPFGSSPGLLAEHDGRIVGVRLFMRCSWRCPDSQFSRCGRLIPQPILRTKALASSVP